ncbi:MAG: polyprenyl synthetase family protein [Deltaproteobacteria bacterium]|nr:polyprenyl synthetase family protein [Deltaproteobacteria bacterium]
MGYFAPVSAPERTDLLARLGKVTRSQGLAALAADLTQLHAWVEVEMQGFERELDALPHGLSAVEKSAHHLLDLDGKHLRPMCVVLAAKLGSGWDDTTRNLAMAVELVHTATLLHDDVIDQGDVRRGVPAARLIYGNAASVYAGDWLLVKALKHIRTTGRLDLLDRMLEIIDEMILAESVQLENRGRINAELDDYFHVVEGKTAALFRWAMFAGASAAGLDRSQAEALERYGLHLGVAFQAVDDLLDLGGDSRHTGKALFTDLREGKMTYPLILALQREPSLRPVIERCIQDDGELEASAIDTVLDVLARTGAVDDCRKLAAEHSARAITALDGFDDGPGKRALMTVARATATRDK